MYFFFSNTFCTCGISGWVRLGSLSSYFWSASLASTGENFVHPTVLSLHVLDLHDVLQAVYGTSKVYLPYCGIAVLPVLARVHGPLSEQCRIPFPVVASLLGVDPRHLKDRFVLVQPLEAAETTAVDHPVYIRTWKGVTHKK